MVAHQQLHGDLPRLRRPRRIGHDDLAVLRDRGTGTQQLRAALRLDDAQTAAGVMLQLTVFTQVGDLDPVLRGDLQDRLPGSPGAFFAIDDDFDFSHDTHLPLVHRH